MSEESGKSSWDELMARLAQERDELALKLHLGKKEALAEWEKLEARWKELRAVKGPPLKEAAAETAQGLGSALEAAAGELKKGYEKLRKIL
jgi:hypothetical protein